MEIDEGLLGRVSEFLNTPDGINILNGLKESLGSNSGEQKCAPNLDLGNLFSSTDKSSNDTSGVDMAKLLPLISAISSAKTDDRATNLLLALKPLLKNDRSKKVDHAVSIMRILALLPILKEHGFDISDLLG